MEEQSKPLTLKVGDQVLDVTAGVPFTIGDWKEVAKKGVKLNDLDNLDLGGVFVLLAQVLKKAGHPHDEATVDKIVPLKPEVRLVLSKVAGSEVEAEARPT